MRLPLPGMDLPHVHTLRTLADCRAIIAQAATVATRRRHGRELHRPRGRRIAARPRHRGARRRAGQATDGAGAGPQMGDFVRRLHEEHGVVFHLEDTAAVAIDARQVTLKSGGTIAADLVVAGVGVRPRLAACGEGRPRDRSRREGQRVPGDQRAGDIRCGRHRPLARQAQRRVSASSTGSSRSARGKRRRSTCLAVARSSTPCRFSGASTTTCRSTMSATPSRGTRSLSTATSQSRDCVVRYKRKGRVLAVASIYRDSDSLMEEVAMEREPA